MKKQDKKLKIAKRPEDQGRRECAMCGEWFYDMDFRANDNPPRLCNDCATYSPDHLYPHE